MPPSSDKSAINVQARTGPTPGIDVSSRYRCASVASVATDQTLVEQLDVAGQPADRAPRKGVEHRVFQQSEGILSGDFLSAELTANNEHLDELLRCRRRPLRWTRRHDADERSDHSGVERIVLSQNPACLGELPQLERIDLAHGHAGCRSL